jgi:hypothetical protein
MINGRPFEVPPALHEVYADEHPFIVIRKPSQVGVTEYNINLALWAADTGYAGRGNCLYILPTGEMAARISQARANKAIAESTYLRQRTKPESTELRGPSNMYRRSVGPGIVYFTGSDQETQYSGIDADLVILDEFDLMKEEVLSLAQARTRSSRRPLVRVTSTPTLPDVGVSYLYEQSDQRFYELECPACGSWQEPQFPASVDWERLAVVCLQCRAALDPWRPGRWTARNPAVTEIHGYQLSRLILPNPPLYDMKLIMDERVPTTLETFYRQDLGMAHVSEESRLTPDVIERCAADYEIDLKLKTVVMGIDVGKRLHVVIRGRFNDEWYLLDAFTVTEFEELEACFACYNIVCCVVDARPETRAALAFQQRHRGVVWLANYLQQGVEPDWDWHSGVVSAPRTLIIDEMMHRFRTANFHVPSRYREIEGGAYFKELQSPVRTEEPDRFGHPVATYSHTRPDDFAHAEVYATLASIRAALTGGVIFLGLDSDGRWRAQSPRSSDFDV